MGSSCEATYYWGGVRCVFCLPAALPFSYDGSKQGLVNAHRMGSPGPNGSTYLGTIMKRYAKQELACGIVFFAACGWMIFDAVLSDPSPPSLWPLIPMFLSTVWYVGIEHVRSYHDAK